MTRLMEMVLVFSNGQKKTFPAVCRKFVWLFSASGPSSVKYGISILP